MRRIIPSIVAALLLCLVSTARADVKLAGVFGDNMVLQADKPLPVWGWATPGEAVSVTIGDQKKSATAGADGKWMLKLDPVKTGGPMEMSVAGKNTIGLKNILIGEVWVCSGQSNMGFGFPQAYNAADEGPKANYPKIRLFTVKHATALQPLSDTEGTWAECTPETVKGFSAAAYFFGRDLHKALGVPVGLIHTSWGGTPAQSWTSMEGLKSESGLDVYVKSYDSTVANLATLEKKYRDELLPKWEADQKKWNETVGKQYREDLAKWQKESAAAKAAGKEAPAQPARVAMTGRKPTEPGKNPGVPTVLNNAMVAPLAPLAIKGAIWYQGEANAGQPMLYRTLFPAMIKDWRRQFAQGDFPFVWVQLANYMKRETEPTQGEGGWAGLREAQSGTLALPNTGEAVIIDIGEAGDIHPKNKVDVGARLALAAEKVAYGKDVVYSGPRYESMNVEGEKVRIKFKNVGGGLAIGAAPIIRMGQEANKPLDHLVGFSIAGEDKKFVWAEAKIDGDGVVVWSDAVKKPVAVRYAWANNPECNLYNKEALPASPFRTDDWVAPAPPQGKR
ncbi:MAG: Sialic acid-specific 9-O-acetylesterase [Phycisphaerales bacterium]|nr:Sialic acid-specific 9-O-acetylesterase [Phycisphaerales bacterium]